MIQVLIDNPLLLLFVVAAIGYPLGQVRVAGVKLGVAAVLFVALAIGSLHPDLKLPEVIYTLGLILFVYTVGLSSGADFFASLHRGGLRSNLLVLGMLVAAALITVAIHRLLGLSGTVTAGMYAGSLTNTPALAGVLEYVKGAAASDVLDRALNEPVIGYSITYPMGVLAMIVAIVVAERLWRVDYAAEAEAVPDIVTTKDLEVRTVRVSRLDAAGKTVRDLIRQQGWDVVFARLRRGGRMRLVSGNVRLQRGDLLSLVGTREELDRATEYLGEPSERRLDFDRSELDYRRMFVSNPEVAGRHLRDLHLIEDLGAVVTRVRRGDLELLPDGDTVLQLGDQVRVLSQRQRLEQVRGIFGDSYRALAEIDLLTFGLGVGLGLLVGLIPIPLPGGIVFKLGFAGGPLLVGLVLGARGRTGPLIWLMPYSANLTLRQVGLVLFLAGIGTRSGNAFVTTLTQGNGIWIFLAGAIVTTATALGTLWIGYRLLQIPMGLLAGMLAGLQTQPAVLGFSLEQTRNELPNIGYATVYPLAMISKILVAQLVLTLLL